MKNIRKRSTLLNGNVFFRGLPKVLKGHFLNEEDANNNHVLFIGIKLHIVQF